MQTPNGTEVQIVPDGIVGRFALLHRGERIGTLTHVLIPTGRGRIPGWRIVDAGPGVDTTTLPDHYIRNAGLAAQAILDARANAQAQADGGLTTLERAILDFETDHAFAPDAARIAAAEIRFHLSEWRYLQLLNRMVTSPDSRYRDYAPEVIQRLERKRAEQMLRGPRSARAAAIARLLADTPPADDAAVTG
jgi:hypothetical protein